MHKLRFSQDPHQILHQSGRHLAAAAAVEEATTTYLLSPTTTRHYYAAQYCPLLFIIIRALLWILYNYLQPPTAAAHSAVPVPIPKKTTTITMMKTSFPKSNPK